MSFISLERNGVLLLEDGEFFIGFLHCSYPSTGEIVFNTGMTGYQEIFTDSSYFGQIVLSTSVHIGNYGIVQEEKESTGLKISGLVCKDFSAYFSRHKSDTISLKQYFEESQVPVISGIDTRKLVRHIRGKGTMNAMISPYTDNIDISVLLKDLLQIPSMLGLELSSKVMCANRDYILENAEHLVVCIDFGIKHNIINSLLNRGVSVKVVPYTCPVESILKLNPDGILLSNGPGDPSSMSSSVDKVKTFLTLDIPIMGICLGHQLLSIANGLKTRKMKYGHRGLNHPVMYNVTGKSEITSQNHGFVVDGDFENEAIQVTHTHLNDGSISGIIVKNKPFFSVQYHPESSPGPNDSKYLFDLFIHNIRNKKCR